MRDLLFVPMEDWDEQWRRNQVVCAELARRHPQHKILFHGVSRNLLGRLRAGRPPAIPRSAVATVSGHPNITTTRPLRGGLERFGWGVRLNLSLMRRHLLQLSRR